MKARGKRRLEGLSPAEAAAHWLVRHDMEDMSAAEHQQFRAWIAESPRHGAAFEQARRRWGLFAQTDDDQHIRALRKAALAVGPERRARLWPQLAAGLAVLIGAAWLFAALDGPALVTGTRTSLDQLGVPDYVTAKGERLNLSLPDGTAVTLNTESALDVAYGDGRRFVHLTRGQAFFDITRDRSRPFVVQVGKRQITALGTAFDVRLVDGTFEVLLVEGKIAVEEQAPAGTESPVALPEPVIMTSGQELVIKNGTVARNDAVNLDRELRWRDGFVEFQNQTLGEAVAEFNRYSRSPILIEDERVAALRVTGVFRTDRVNHFLEAISGLLPIAIDTRSHPAVRLVLAQSEGDEKTAPK